MELKFGQWMEMALAEAELVVNDVPVGAILLDTYGTPVAVSRNSRASNLQLLGHAETNVIFSTWGKSNFGNLSGFTLVTTLEPCLTCAAVIVETEISRVIFGACNPQRGAAGSLYDILRDPRLGHPIEVIGGVFSERAQSLLDAFFKKLRK